MDSAEREKLKRTALELLALAEPSRHSPGFGSLRWGNSYYTFTASQARIVAMLFQAYLEQVPDVRQETLLAAAGSEGRKIANLFRDHPCWNVLIVPGPLKGLFRLQPPPESANPPEKRP